MTSVLSGFIHRFVPSKRETPPVTLLLLHGAGGNECSMLPLGRKLLPEAAMLCPRGNVLEDGKTRFFRRLREGVFDTDDLVFRTCELANFIEAAADAYRLDPNRVVAVGYSNGANIAASLLLLKPEVLAGAVLLRPVVPLLPDVLPDLSGVPVFIGAGASDRVAPAVESEKLEVALRSAGADVTLRLDPEGHKLSRDELRAAKTWLVQKVSSI
ncbi:MAG: alpha/beta hydrolase [Armatimonadetes bacterium]|nr:alpha/beta hydrolase [Armatimonadota bacterium]